MIFYSVGLGGVRDLGGKGRRHTIVIVQVQTAAVVSAVCKTHPSCIIYHHRSFASLNCGHCHRPTHPWSSLLFSTGRQQAFNHSKSNLMSADRRSRSQSHSQSRGERVASNTSVERRTKWNSFHHSTSAPRLKIRRKKKQGAFALLLWFNTFLKV